MTPRIEVAERPGVGADGAVRPSEDVVVVLPNAVVLLDGATPPEPGSPTGGWYASRLAGELAGRLAGYPDADLADLLAASIKVVVRDHELSPGRSPSSTVAVLRWNARTVEGLVLAHSPIVAFTARGESVLATGEDGVAESDPDVAYSARRAAWPRDAVATVLMASDGVASGVDTYDVFADWLAVRDLAARSGPEAVLDRVRAAERSDPDGVRWPRPEPHDDQALVVANFTGAVGTRAPSVPGLPHHQR